MKSPKQIQIVSLVLIFVAGLSLYTCNGLSNKKHKIIQELKVQGLSGEIISAENFFKGIAPPNFSTIAGTSYKPSYNKEPEIPPQCWIETSYGTQNACRYCHTDYLTQIKHGNAFPSSEDQELYNFPTSSLNKILWQNIIYPQNIENRLSAEGITIPDIEDVEYVRHDNWMPTFDRTRGNGNDKWVNHQSPDANFILFPSLNPNHLFPYNEENPTQNGAHGYIDHKGFVVAENHQQTGWRAINFFPYALFTPLTGSVSGIYIKLPYEFMTKSGEVDMNLYEQNLEILEKNIKNKSPKQTHYLGDAQHIEVKKGFYPVGTEFAHPLHYVDLNADGEVGLELDGVTANNRHQYEFPGTRSKRVKEIRYMYKWKEVELEDIAEEDDDDEDFGTYVGVEGKGWIDNNAGWVLAAFIENRDGELRPQTTEEMAQCLGCHAKVGTTVDAVWSFQRKLPGVEGWTDMNYGKYSSKKPEKTKLHDYLNEQSKKGELGYFYHSVIGADLYGVMSAEMKNELTQYATKSNIELPFTSEMILDDEILKWMPKEERMPRLLARQTLMRDYSKNVEYLRYSNEDDSYYIKGDIFYPTQETMKSNIQGYRKIVLDQSYNLGKDVFGSTHDHVPFTFRSDGTVLDENKDTIPVGSVIFSRPYDDEGVGISSTGIIEGNAFDINGHPVSSFTEEDVINGNINFSGTLDKYYNSILSDKIIEK